MYYRQLERYYTEIVYRRSLFCDTFTWLEHRTLAVPAPVTRNPHPSLITCDEDMWDNSLAGLRWTHRLVRLTGSQDMWSSDPLVWHLSVCGGGILWCTSSTHLSRIPKSRFLSVLRLAKPDESVKCHACGHIVEHASGRVLNIRVRGHGFIRCD